MSSARIQLLSPLLANQIAAGEVVERPSSVVKELMENSLDAGARRIDIEVEEGGIKLIRVRDDGNGIQRDELALALSRHATSKIRDFDDLVAVRSLGFRGEALPSIASVSRLTLTSRSLDGGSAWHVRSPGGRVGVPAPAAHLRHNGREVHALRAANSAAERAQRVAARCGRDFIDNAVEIGFEAMDLKLAGWIGLPTFSRGQADMQHFYVNGRVVRDRLVAHAVRQAYHDVLYHGRHPAFVLYLEVPAQDVDVNVHPTKHEVRFRDGRLVHDDLFRGLHDALARVRPGAEDAAVIPPSSSVSSAGFAASTTPRADLQAAMPLAVREQMSSYAALHPAPAVHVEAESQSDTIPPLGFAVAQLHGVYVLAQNREDIHAVQ